jgi:hypothetical protein
MSEKTQKIQMGGVSLNDIKQTEIDDAGKNELCLALCDLQLAAAQLGLRQTLDDVNKWIDEAVATGAIASKDGKNSFRGFVNNHEKLAAIVGLKGVRKIYEKFDVGRITALLQWRQAVELRDEGRHSLLCVNWYKEDGKFYGATLDPWPFTDDKRIDLERATTQRKNAAGAWVDSRTIEFIGYYKEE